MACRTLRILVPRPGIDPMLPAEGVWTTRDVAFCQWLWSIIWLLCVIPVMSLSEGKACCVVQRLVRNPRPRALEQPAGSEDAQTCYWMWSQWLYLSSLVWEFIYLHFLWVEKKRPCSRDLHSYQLTYVTRTYCIAPGTLSIFSNKL